MLRSVLGWLASQGIAFVALGLSGWALLRERRHVRVEVSPGAAISSAGGSARRILHVTVSNLGRAVTVRSPFIESVPKGVVSASPLSLANLLPGAEQFADLLPKCEPVALTRRLDKGEVASWLMEVSVGDRADRETLRLFASVHVFGGRVARSERFSPVAFWPTPNEGQEVGT